MSKTNNSFIKTLIRSFGFAINGIKLLASERSFRIHLIVGTLVIIAGLYLGLSLTEWSVISIAIGMVLTAEAFNSGIEEICNRITEDLEPSIKRIKDISAAAVLFVAIASVIVGLLIFVPKII